MKLQDLLRHIADNVENGEIWSEGIDISDKAAWEASVFFGEADSIKLKPRTHVVNGFTVPAPETVKPPKYTPIFYGDPSMKGWHIETTWHGTEIDLRMLERGNVFLTREAAIANEKARYNIDPYSEGEE
jgi:hypothetical protein